MAITPSDILRAADAPLDVASTMRTLDVTTTSGSLTLAEGVYDVINQGSVYAYARIGATALVPPSTGAAEVTGFPLPNGAASTVRIASGSEVFHAITATSTATLVFVRKARP